MEMVGALEHCRQKLWEDVQRLAQATRRFSATTLHSIDQAVPVLADYRKEIYEELNQIQHEYALVRAMEWLNVHRPDLGGLVWYWNPRAGGTKDEPDLRGADLDGVRISAEVTTSPHAKGVLHSRMKRTLAKLSLMEGEHFYFVVGTRIERQAQTSIRKTGYNIAVVNLAERAAPKSPASSSHNFKAETC
ncbi:hypothetical protein [Rhizobium bangladeshense]|uniref:hypothetical protein n=1 Tax=Rhizobium bangladeshense TaxID=1138189 RepID=UPI001A9899FE|nr:hypothetical protein [Rhizobium bangladeshense]MBX4932180.1 hypothetical protein [Rhizobium bangladeshense]QSY89514.1 hypothetical protein J2J98_05055 [Rhizobium bangladeshense]